MQVVEVSPVRVTGQPVGVDHAEPATALPAVEVRIVAEAETASATEVFLVAVAVVLSVVAARVAAQGPAVPVVHPAWEGAGGVAGVVVGVDAGGNAMKQAEEKL